MPTASTSTGPAPTTATSHGSRLGEGVLQYYEEGGPLPFGDDTFDVVISDQVFEHVVPIEASVREIERVLKPGGVSYHHFPSRAVWREGHIGIPFAHRLPHGRLRLPYTTGLRTLGIGIFKDSARRATGLRRSCSGSTTGPSTARRARSTPSSVAVARLTNSEIEYCRFRAADRPVLPRCCAGAAYDGRPRRCSGDSHLRPSRRARSSSKRPVQPAARVKVTCVTPVGEDVASTS